MHILSEDYVTSCEKRDHLDFVCSMLCRPMYVPCNVLYVYVFVALAINTGTANTHN